MERIIEQDAKKVVTRELVGTQMVERTYSAKEWAEKTGGAVVTRPVLTEGKAPEKEASAKKSRKADKDKE